SRDDLAEIVGRHEPNDPEHALELGAIPSPPLRPARAIEVEEPVRASDPRHLLLEKELEHPLATALVLLRGEARGSSDPKRDCDDDRAREHLAPPRSARPCHSSVEAGSRF